MNVRTLLLPLVRSDLPQAVETTKVGLPDIDGLPSHSVRRDVVVTSTLNPTPRLRSAIEVCEWLLETVPGSLEVALTLVLSESVKRSFLLRPEDAEDLSQALDLFLKRTHTSSAEQ